MSDNTLRAETARSPGWTKRFLPGIYFRRAVRIGVPLRISLLPMLWWTLQQLKSKDAGTRLAAIETLADDVTPRVAAALVPVLSDPEESVRRAAAKAIGTTRMTSSFHFSSRLW